MNDQEIWEKAYNAALTGALSADAQVGTAIGVAVAAADRSLAAHKERWPTSVAAAVAVTPLTLPAALVSTIARVASELADAGRHDAHKVMSSLLDALRGGAPSSWTAPPRG